MSIRKQGKGLQGRAVLLSASVPDPRRKSEYQVEDQPGSVYTRVDDAHVEVERAAVSLARAVFSNRGRLVFGGHPSISPLIAMVAAEYRSPRPNGADGEGTPVAAEREHPGAEELPLVVIYQSRAYEAVVPDDTWLLHRYGYAEIRWTEAVDGERYRRELAGQPQCPASLALMRKTMLRESDPVAMVAIGGMKGVRDEAEVFRNLFRHRPVYVIATTGGAAAWLAQNAESVDAIDQRLMARLAQVRRDRPVEPESGREEPAGFRFPPYPLIMQVLADELTGRAERRPPRT